MEFSQSKIFGIGFQKTGTSSLAAALRILGFSVTGPNGKADPEIETNVLSLIQGLVPRFDAFQDNPWPVMYRELDRLYPGSKFILTLRDPDEWLASVVRHFSGRTTPMRKWIYGSGDPEGHEAEYLERYNNHNAAVQKYFQDRSDTTFVVMSIADGDGWDVLCPFLGLSTRPSAAFPHENRALLRESRFRRLTTRLGLTDYTSRK